MVKSGADSEARQRILAVADRLFFTEGIRVTGVDTLVAQSDVAKTTFYRHFASKDDLIVAYLEDRDRRFWEYLSAPSDDPALSAKAQIYTLMEKLDRLINQSDTHGCPFLLASGEFPDLHHPAHQVAILHKKKLKDKLTELAQSAEAKQAAALANGLALLIDGAFSARRLIGAGGSTIVLMEPAKQLLQAYDLSL